jgi:hypothetical protein
MGAWRVSCLPKVPKITRRRLGPASMILRTQTIPRSRRRPSWRAFGGFSLVLLAMAFAIHWPERDPVQRYLRALYSQKNSPFTYDPMTSPAWWRDQEPLPDDQVLAILRASLDYRPLTLTGAAFPNRVEDLGSLVAYNLPLRQRVLAEVIAPALQDPSRDLGARIVLVALATHFGATDPALPPLVLRTLQDAMARQYEQENQPWREALLWQA